MISYFDIHGNTLPSPQHIQQQSENPSTFNAALFFSMKLRGLGELRSFDKQFKAKYLTNGNTWRTMEKDPNANWSHDEKLSALAYFNYTNQKEWIDRIPVFANPFKNSSWLSWLRPDVLAYTLAVKYPWTYNMKIVRAFIWYKIGDSMEDFIKDPKGQSSGAQKAFIMMMGLKKVSKINEFDKLINWARVFENYYPDYPEHPTRLIWEGD